MPLTSLTSPDSEPNPVECMSTHSLENRVRTAGLCTTTTPTAQDDPWFPITAQPARFALLARTACFGCEVLAECREWSIREESVLKGWELHGIRGGLAPHERLRLIREYRVRQDSAPFRQTA